MDFTRTIFVTSFHGIISKNILETDALRDLARDPKTRIVIFVPERKISFFRETYVFPNVFFEGVDAERITGTRANSFAYIFAQLLIDSHYLWYKKVERLDAAPTFKNKIKFRLEILFTKLFGNSRMSNRMYRALDGFFADATPHIAAYFTQYKPVAIFSTDIFDKADVAFLREAKRQRVMTLGMVRSWDNCYSKGVLRIIPERVVVNNELIKNELATLHDVDPNTITMVGFPQFDRFPREEKGTREEYLHAHGLTVERKTILFSPVGAPLSDTDWEVLQICKDALADGRIRHDAQVLVRLHPGRDLPLGTFVAKDRLVFDRPGVYSGKDVDFSPDDVKHLIQSLYHVDLVVWVATTICLDAAVFNKPQIVVNFDGFKNKEYRKSIRRYHNEDHMKDLLDMEGVTRANSPEELIAWVNAYLDDPRVNQEKRDDMVRQELYCLDEKAGARVAAFIHESITSLTHTAK